MRMGAKITGAAAGLLGVAAIGFFHPSDFGSKEGEAAGPIVYRQHGMASWYGPGFHGRKTASGERFNQNERTAAHRQLPLGSEVTVTNLENGKSVEVEINDRGPYVKGRRIDLSKAAAREIGMHEDGTARVRIEATAEQLGQAKGDRNKR
jgi:rare lipoprotein A (peptidoglycan hydrolase)